MRLPGTHLKDLSVVRLPGTHLKDLSVVRLPEGLICCETS